MTKRDAADIALVWIGLKVFLQSLSILSITIGRLCSSDAPNTTWDSPVAWYSMQTVFILVLSFILLFKRRCVLNLLFPLASQTEMTISDGCAALTKLSFWIRLLGTFTLIQAAIKLISSLVQYLPAKHTTLGVGFIWTTVTTSLVTIPLALLVVWQADRIAALMNKLGKSNIRLETDK